MRMNLRIHPFRLQFCGLIVTWSPFCFRPPAVVPCELRQLHLIVSRPTSVFVVVYRKGIHQIGPKIGSIFVSIIRSFRNFMDFQKFYGSVLPTNNWLRETYYISCYQDSFFFTISTGFAMVLTPTIGWWYEKNCVQPTHGPRNPQRDLAWDLQMFPSGPLPGGCSMRSSGTSGISELLPSLRHVVFDTFPTRSGTTPRTDSERQFTRGHMLPKSSAGFFSFRFVYFDLFLQRKQIWMSWKCMLYCS